MFRYNTGKKTFIIAALVILLCLVCLIGATLAIFTSDLSDGTIGIVTTSGDVEIDIVDAEGVTLQDKALSFVTTYGTTGTDSVYFEPGATYYTQVFAIDNLGNIPVSFRVSVSKDDDVDSEAFAKAFELWIVKADEADISTAERMTQFVGNLPAGEKSSEYILVIKMKEIAGNEFQGKSYEGIGITVYAVQGNVNVKE